MSVGFANWGTLFAARLLVGVAVVLGLLALIVPGVYLMLRFGFVEQVVVIEGTRAGQSLDRSTELTKGLRWPLLGVWTVSVGAVMLFGFLIYIPVAIIEEVLGFGPTEIVALETLVDCFLDVLLFVPTIATFLFYWEARHAPRVPSVLPQEAPGESPRAD